MRKTEAHQVLIEFGVVFAVSAGQEARRHHGAVVDAVAFEEGSIAVEEKAPVGKLATEQRVGPQAGRGVDEVDIGEETMTGLM